MKESTNDAEELYIFSMVSRPTSREIFGLWDRNG
jgi:hypothetical protein